ncbi:argininosuccinate lyase [Rhodobacteraceae bacterium CCMM004]|nr:argininosuccinate lyase [Rhodobacteraceae bacterium CCMM004]
MPGRWSCAAASRLAHKARRTGLPAPGAHQRGTAAPRGGQRPHRGGGVAVARTASGPVGGAHDDQWGRHDRISRRNTSTNAPTFDTGRPRGFETSWQGPSKGLAPVTDTSAFPDPVYRETVLEPLFEGVRTHYAGHMDAINRAHLVMLTETGILPRADAARIAGALSDIAADTDPASLTYTGEHEDWFFLVEAELRRRLGDLGGALHTARSRNDMDHTMFKMVLRDRAATLLDEGLALAATLRRRAGEEAGTPIVAYTHGQPAQPSTFGHYLAAVLEVLLGDLDRLARAMQALDACPMGAAAIITTGFPIDRDRVAHLLGFERPRLNSYACIAGVDYVTGLYSAIKLVFLHLGRVVQDMAFWSAFEVGQLYVPNALVQVSSIMPQKRNPVPIEHMRHLAAVTCGHCDTIVDTMRNTPFTDMNDSEGEVQQAGYAAFASGGRMLRLAEAFLGQVRIDGARVRATADAACITVTELADTLVRDEGLTFRAAHEIAAATARAAIAARAPLSASRDAFAAAFRDQTGRDTALGPDAYAAAVSMEGFVARRDRPGGPAPAALAAALDTYAATHAALADTLAAGRARRREAEADRAAAFAALLET